MLSQSSAAAFLCISALAILVVSSQWQYYRAMEMHQSAFTELQELKKMLKTSNAGNKKLVLKKKKIQEIFTYLNTVSIETQSF